MKNDIDILKSKKNINISNSLKKYNSFRNNIIVENSKMIKRRISRPRWRRISRIVRERDSFTCQFCGADVNNFLQVHHVDFNENNDDLSNLITVCASCHQKIHKSIIIPNCLELYDMYINNGMSLRSIAILYGVSKYSIADRLEKCNISIRTLSQARKNYLINNNPE